MSDLESLRTLMQEPEDLHPDLEACLYESEIGPIIKHPLVNSIMHLGAMNAMANRQLAHKRSQLKLAREKADWSWYIWIHERPWRLDALEAVEDEMDNETYWELLGQVWIDSENIRETRHIWETHLHSPRGGRTAIMTPEEVAALAEMPERLEIWQGCTTASDDGWSWTLDEEKAAWFANRFSSFEDEPPRLRHGTCAKADVLAYFDRRNESEILIDPERVEER